MATKKLQELEAAKEALIQAARFAAARREENRSHQAITATDRYLFAQARRFAEAEAKWSATMRAVTRRKPAGRVAKKTAK